MDIISDKAAGDFLDSIDNAPAPLVLGGLAVAFGLAAGATGVISWEMAQHGLYGPAALSGLLSAWTGAVSLTTAVAPVVQWAKNMISGPSAGPS